MLEGERTVEAMIDGVQTWGDHLLQVEGAICEEHVSQPFAFSVTLLSEEGDEVAGLLPEMIGRHAILRVEVVGTLFRYFSGIIASFVQSGVRDQQAAYRMEMVPWLWLLSQRRSYRIFQFQDVPTILDTIFNEWRAELGDQEAFRVADRTSGPFGVRDYCVQYDETDLAFVRRLMAEEGISYFFEHDDRGHGLVLVDAPDQHDEFRIGGQLRLALSGTQDVDSITSLRLVEEAKPTAHVVSDYHFENPARAVRESNEAIAPFARPLHEVLSHPGGHAGPFVGRGTQGSERLDSEMPPLARRLVTLQVERADCEMMRAQGTSHMPHLCPGYLMDAMAESDAFDTAGTRRYYKDVEGRYLVLGVRHEISGGGHRDAGVFSYTNTFEALPQDVASVERLGLLQPLPLRPPQTSGKPRALGPETAVVVGPAGEEIHTDKYGRVKVQFLWDRRDLFNEESSCWVRVAQPWAGKRWGAIFIPRIGQEVIVDFLGGDPDRPIITGSVYNADQMPPYLGDGPDPNHKHDPRISGIKTSSTPGGKGFNELRFYDAKGKEQIFIHAERDQHNRVQNDSFEFIGNDRHLIVKKNQLERVDGDKHLTVGGDRNEKIGGTISRHAGMDIQEKAGMSITLTAGGGFIVVGPTGVTISGMPVLINSGGAAGAGSGASPEAPENPVEALIAKPGEQPATPPPAEPPSEEAQALAEAQRTTLKEAAKSGVPFCEKCEAARRAAAGG